VPILRYKEVKHISEKGHAMKKLFRHHSAAAGFTLIEVLVVIGIMGILLLGSIPSILNIMATRDVRIPMIPASCSEGSRPGVGAKRRRA